MIVTLGSNSNDFVQPTVDFNGPSLSFKISGRYEVGATGMF